MNALISYLSFHLFLIGTGIKIEPLSPEIEEVFKKNKFNMSIMDTGAAIRTFNVLLAENRLVGAFFYPVS